MKASKSPLVLSGNSHDWKWSNLALNVLFDLLRHRIGPTPIQKIYRCLEQGVPRMSASHILTQRCLHEEGTSCMRISTATRTTMKGDCWVSSLTLFPPSVIGFGKLVGSSMKGVNLCSSCEFTVALWYTILLGSVEFCQRPRDRV